MNTFVGLAISDSMFPPGSFRKEFLSIDQVKTILNNKVKSCVNPSHQATVGALKKRFDIDIPVPKKAIKASLQSGNQLLVCTVHGLPRETREFTVDEIDQATFTFSLWSID